MGDRCTFARMMAWVAAVVRVMAHWICGFSMASVSAENGSGGSSPGCISRRDQSMVRPSSRGGVPVLSRPRVNPSRSKVSDSPIAGASPTRPAGVRCSPIWMRPRRKVPVVRTTAAAAQFPAIAKPDAGGGTVVDEEVVGLPLDHRQVRASADRLLHRSGVEPPIGLRPRAPDRRSLAPIENAKLDAALVGDPAHQSVEGIDLADEMALAQAADGGIAGHGADGVEAMGDERSLRAHARRRGRGLAAGMPAADHDDIVTCVHMAKVLEWPDL